MKSSSVQQPVVDRGPAGNMTARNAVDLRRCRDLLFDDSKNNFNSCPVYGPFERLFLNDWGQSNIHYNITQAFVKMNIDRMTPVQQHSFLYLLNNYNTAIIGFSKGKSISYLTSIFSLIMNDKCSGDNMHKVSIGPIAVILSSSLGSCSELEDLSQKLLCLCNQKIKVAVANSSVPLQKTIASICNGCDVLISTPSSLYNLLLKMKLFSWSNLKHIVFDKIDLLLENYKDEMFHFSKIITVVKKEINDFQMIAVSVKWSREIHAFMSKLFIKWQYIFGCHLQAAYYMNVRFNFVQAENNKMEKILENLKYNIKWQRCVLVASKRNDLRTIYNCVRKIITNDDIEILLPDNNKRANIYIMQKWNEKLLKKKLICICSDEMLYNFYIDSSDCLIHYDIPDTKTPFSTRFSVLQDSTISLTKRESNTYVYLGSNNKDMLQLPKIVEIMKMFGNGKVPPVLLENSKLIIETLEKEKKNCFLCNNVLQFGLCLKLSTCQNRHMLLKEIDEPVDNFPRSGLAIVQILYVYDASHLSVKLLKLNCTNNLNDVQYWTTLKDYSSTIHEGLSLLYASHSSRLIHKNPNIGDLVTVQLEFKIKEYGNTEFFRGIVIDYVDKNSINPKLMVKLIDLGLIKTVSKWSVYELPSEWKNMPTTTADIFLASVKPVDSDTHWCSKADLWVETQLKFAQDCNSTFIVNIEFALGTTLLVKKLYKKFLNPESKTYQFEPILPDILFNNGYADRNVEHIEKLTELCVLAGIETQLALNNIGVKEKHCNQLSLDDFMSLYKLPQPQWAHLDRIGTVVSVEYVISPNLFLVRNSKYLDRVDELQKKINEFVQDKKVKNLEHIINGAFCLAKQLGTEQYSRSQIVEVGNDRFVEVLFVDLGQFDWVDSDSLLTIHPHLITQLPFQAIECGLSGVKDELPSGEELDKLVDYLFDMTRDLFYLKVIDTVSLGKFTGGNHYEIMLYTDLITINLEFMTEFDQYCDEFQMARLMPLPKDEDEDYREENYAPCVVNETEIKPIVFDEHMFDDKNFLPEELETRKMFFDQFGLASFGQFYKDLLKKVDAINVKNPKEEHLVTIADVSDPMATNTKNVPNDHQMATNSKSEDSQCKPVASGVKPEKSFSMKNRKLKLNVKRENICLTCNTSKQSIFVPICTWYQDDSNIYLKFDILEIDKFSVDCTIQNITFNARVKDTSYTFNANLYGPILADFVTHKRSYEGFHIKAEKLYKTNYKWPRLFSCDKWHRYVKYDSRFVEAKDLKMWMNEVNKMKLKAVNISLNNFITEAETSECDEFLACDDIDYLNEY